MTMKFDDKVTEDTVDFKAVERAHERFRQLTPQEKVNAIHDAIAAIREGLTEKEIEAIAEAINFKYVPEFDESEWDFPDQDDARKA